MQAVVLAGGRGTELRPLTDTVPAPLLLVEQEPAFHLLLQRLEAARVSEIIVAAGEHRGELSSLVLNRGYRPWVQVLPEPDLAGDAAVVKRLERLLPGAFLLVKADAVFDCDLRGLIEAHFRQCALVTVAAMRSRTGGVGCALEIDDTGRVRAVEAPAGPGRMVAAGPCVIEPAVLKKVPAGRRYEVVSNLLRRLIATGAPVFAADLAGRWTVLDSLENYLDCQRWRLRTDGHGGSIHPSAWVAPGARLHPPFFIGPGSRVEHGAVVGPDAVLTGQVQVGALSRVSDSIVYPKVRIGARCSISSSVIAPDVWLENEVTLEPHVIVGAGMRLDYGSVLRARSRIACTPPLTPAPSHWAQAFRA